MFNINRDLSKSNTAFKSRYVQFSSFMNKLGNYAYSPDVKDVEICLASNQSQVGLYLNLTQTLRLNIDAVNRLLGTCYKDCRLNLDLNLNFNLLDSHFFKLLCESLDPYDLDIDYRDMSELLIKRYQNIYDKVEIDDDEESFGIFLTRQSKKKDYHSFVSGLLSLDIVRFLLSYRFLLLSISNFDITSPSLYGSETSSIWFNRNNIKQRSPFILNEFNLLRKNNFDSFLDQGKKVKEGYPEPISSLILSWMHLLYFPSFFFASWSLNYMFVLNIDDLNLRIFPDRKRRNSKIMQTGLDNYNKLVEQGQEVALWWSVFDRDDNVFHLSEADTILNRKGGKGQMFNLPVIKNLVRLDLELFLFNLQLSLSFYYDLMNARFIINAFPLYMINRNAKMNQLIDNWKWIENLLLSTI